MIKPVYKFYMGSPTTTIFTQGRTITDAGFFTNGSNDPYTDYCTDYLTAVASKFIYVDFDSTTDLNAIFFFDESRVKISSVTFIWLKSNLIEVPKNAAYWAVRFNDPNFEAKKNQQFIYYMNPVSPHYKNIEKKYSKENDQQFFRESIAGDIRFYGHDYEMINRFSLEDRSMFLITKYNESALSQREDYYKAAFSKTDCKFDHSKKECTPDFSTLDEYENVLSKYNDTYDLIKLAPALSEIGLHKRSLIQVYVAGASTISNFFGGIYWEADVNEPVDDFKDLMGKYYFGYVGTANEFYINDAKTYPDINGTYAGFGGGCLQDKGLYRYDESTPQIVWERDNNQWNVTISFKVYLTRISDNKVLYENSFSISQKLESQNIESQEVIEQFLSKGFTLASVSNPNDKITVNAPITYDVFERLLCDVDTILDNKDTFPLPIEDFVTDNGNYKRCYPIDYGSVIISTATQDEPTKYGMNDFGKYFTDKVLPPSVGGPRPLPISRNSWANTSLWYIYSAGYDLFEKSARKKYTIKDNYSIADAIKALLSKIDPTLKHEATPEYSQFLYGPSNPVVPERFYVYLTQKTNILKGQYDQAAQKAEISFSTLMNMLRDCFRCYWYIENGKFKIEHIKFFMKGGSYTSAPQVQFDMTINNDMFNRKPVSYFQSEVEYDKNELPQRYEFGWADNAIEPFDGVSIDVESSYVQKGKTESIKIDQFSSDVDFMIFDPSNFSNEGFVLLCPVQGAFGLELPIITAQNLIDENGNIYSATLQNIYASWAYLVNMYMYDMPAWRAKCNILSSIQIQGIKRSMVQDVKFPLSEDIDLMGLVRTNIGEGQIEEASVDLDTRQTTLRLSYTPI